MNQRQVENSSAPIPSNTHISSTKFGLFFGVSAMLSIVATLTLGAVWWGIGNVQGRVESLVNEHLHKIRLSVEMRSFARQRTHSIHRMILLEDPFERDEEFMRFNSYGAKFVMARKEFLSSNLTDQERKVLEDQGKLTGQAVPLQNEIVDLVVQEKIEEAKTLLMEHAVPIQDRVIEKLEELHRLQESESAKATDELEKNSVKVNIRIALLSGIAGLLGLVVAALVIRRFNKEAMLRTQQLKDIEYSRTELEQTSKELEIARDEAESANKGKSLFLANMSHELRTPLNAIIGYGEILQEDLESKSQLDQVQDCSNILNSAKHLLSLINGILDISKIESGHMKVECREFDLGSLLKQVESTVEPLIAKNGNQFIIEHNKTESLILVSDSVKIKQILLNLLSNATKFTKNGSIIFKINTEKENNKEWIIFSVTDTGIGISPDTLGQLFKPFTQADLSTTRKYGGTGLGLTISKHFCEMLGGRIEVKSTPNSGSKFTVRLPSNIELGFREAS